MSYAKGPRVKVPCSQLRDLVPQDRFTFPEPEFEETRLLWCAQVMDWPPGQLEILAAPADADRWRRATERLLAVRHEAFETWQRTRSRLNRPMQVGRRLLWRLRWAGREDELVVERKAADDRRRAEVVAAYREFRDQVRDLNEQIETMTAARGREEARRYREYAEALRRARAAAAEDPVWAYRVERRVPNDHESGYLLRARDELVIFLESEISDDDPGWREPAPGGAARGVTAAQVNEEIRRRREQDPYLFVTWRACSAKIHEWTGGYPPEGWQKLTGVAVRGLSLTDDESELLRRRWPSARFHGPSGSDYGFTTF